MGFSFVLALLASAPTGLQAFEAKLAEHDSATVALGEWCAARGFADPPVIRAATRATGWSRLPPPKLRHSLRIGRQELYAVRHVDLSCGDRVLSTAWNWYVPSRLTAEMNTALASTNTPFGRVAAPLKFRRETIATRKGQANGCPAKTISTHVARLVLPDGKPLAYLVECYARANLSP